MITSPAEIQQNSFAVTGPSLHEGVSVLRAKPLSLKRNAIWTAIGNSAYAAAQWLQIALIAHLGTSRDIGRYALAMGYCAPVFMLFNLQLRQVQATDSIRRHSFQQYLGLRVLSSTVALVVVCVFAASMSTAGLLLIMVGLFKSAESISDIYQGWLQQNERMDYVGRSLLRKGVITLTAFGGTYYLTHSLIWAASAMIVGQCFGLVIYDIRASCRIMGASAAASWIKSVQLTFRPDFRFDTLQRLFIRVLPLGIAMMLLSLYSNLPRFVLNKYLGVSAIGVFAAIGYIPLAGSMLINAMGTALAPRLSQYALGDLKQFRKLLSRLAWFAGSLGLLGIAGSILFGRRLLQLFYGIEYARHTDVLVWSMVAAALTYLASAFGFAATARGHFAEQPWVVVVALAILFASAVYLVPIQGLMGAASASVISSFACLCGYASLSFRRTR